MIKEISKRPFVRPLFLWITGICLQNAFPGSYWIEACLLASILILFFVWCRNGPEKIEVQYASRWIWGSVFACLVLAFAGVVTREAGIRSRVAKEDTLLESYARTCQTNLLGKLDQLKASDEEKSVLATLTLGYKKAMNKQIRKRFSIAGVSHILSVSGFHVAVVCGFLTYLLWFLPRNRLGAWIRYPVMILLLWMYVFITGLAPSAVRAGAMLTIYLFGRFLRRGTDGYNTLAASAFCMLAYNPFYLFDIGFQLSYLAVWSILFFQPRFNGGIEVRNPILAAPWGWITVSLAAQAGTSFLCLYYFGQFSWVFLFTNLSVVWLASFLIPAGLLWLLLPDTLPGFGMLQEGVEWLTHEIVYIVDLFSSFPGASYHGYWGWSSLFLGYGMLVMGMVYLIKRKPWQLLATLSLLLIILIVQLIERFMGIEM